MNIRIGTVSFYSSESLGYQFDTEEKTKQAMEDMTRYLNSIIVDKEETSITLSGSFQLTENTEVGILPSVIFNPDLTIDKMLSSILFGGEDNVALYYCKDTIPDMWELYDDISFLDLNNAFNRFKSFTIFYERTIFSESLKRIIPIPEILYTTLKVKDVG